MLVRRPMAPTRARSKSGTANQIVGAAKQAAAQFHPKFAINDAVVFRDSSGVEHRGSIASFQQGSYLEGSDFEYQVALANGSSRGMLECKLQKEAAAAESDSEEGSESEDDAAAPTCSGMAFLWGTVHAGDLSLLRKYMTEEAMSRKDGLGAARKLSPIHPHSLHSFLLQPFNIRLAGLSRDHNYRVLQRIINFDPCSSCNTCARVIVIET